MNKRKKNLIIFLFFILISLISVGAFNIFNHNLFSINTSEKNVIEEAEQCVDFYNKNNKMPQIITGKSNQLFYDSAYLMLKHKESNNEIVVVANYKNEAEDESDIWEFVDLFQNNKEDKITKIIYVYKNNEDDYKYKTINRY